MRDLSDVHMGERRRGPWPNGGDEVSRGDRLRFCGRRAGMFYTIIASIHVD
jgi:hypothetical protein